MNEASGPARRRGRGRRRWWALAVVAVVAALLAGLWLARLPIATRFVERELARRGVPARYTVADLGFGRQRLTDVSIGDPARPDLVADWIETRTRVGLNGVALDGVRAGRVRVRARLVGGRVSLGAVDRLLPAPSGRPFALPAIDLSLGDGRVRLETPAGPVAMRLSGAGRLDDGWSGRIAAVAPRLAPGGGCVVEGAMAALTIRIDRARPVLNGPVRAATLACGATRASGATAAIAATLGAALDRWQGQATLAVARVADPRGQGALVKGTLTFDGSRAATAGTLALAARDVTATAAGTAARLTVAGDYRIGADRRFDGRVTAAGAALDPAYRRIIADQRDAAAGTPLAPLVAQSIRAGVAATQRLALAADVAVRSGKSGTAVRLSRATAVAASGARLHMDGAGVAFGSAGGGIRIDAALAMAGGGLPDLRVQLRRPDPAGPIAGTAVLAPYAAGDARLALSPVRFSATPGGATRIDTVATLSGPLAGGRVDALAVPLSARWQRGGRLIVGAACAPVAWQRLAIGGLVLAPARILACPLGPALVAVDNGRVTGGARVVAPRLAGRLGSSPITLAAGDAVLRLGTVAATVRDLAVRLGEAGRQSRLDLATLTVAPGPRGLGGRFAGGAGQVGAVPLLLSGAQGRWSLAGGRLDVTGEMAVADAAVAAPRFRPLAVRDVALTLAGNRIAADGRLVTPAAGVPVATVTLAHDLAAGTGRADLAVAGVTFGDRLQPEALTPLTFGVVADVRGTIAGDGHVRWGPDGVTSTGAFGTDRLDLAAAFGPVTGIVGRIRFTDLLALESAPDQVVTVASVNPGIAVTDGIVRFRTLAGSRVDVAEGRWPFAGGTLTLAPTLLDFSRTGVRAMTFHVDGVAADQFLQQFDFKNLDATGVFDGVLPMLFDAAGGRIEGGRLQVRDGGGTIAYVGEVSRKNLGFWGNLAFGALRSLRYRSLALTMNGPLAGEMLTEVRFAGISQGEGARANFLVRRLQRLPFVFNVRIRAPFRGLIDSARSFYDPSLLVGRNLPALIEQQNRARPVTPPTPPAAPPVQPPATRIMP